MSNTCIFINTSHKIQVIASCHIISYKHFLVTAEFKPKTSGRKKGKRGVLLPSLPSFKTALDQSI